MNDIFKKVHLSDKKKLFRIMAELKALLLVKLEQENVFQVYAEKVNEDKFLECKFKDGDKVNLVKSEVGVVNLSFGEDRYFFSGVISFVADKVLIDIQDDLYFLQRRKSARMEIPDTYPASARILDLNGKIQPYEFKILDFSSGGCRLSLAAIEPFIKVNAKFKLLITLGHRSSFDVDVQVRHVKEINSIKDLPQVMGVQFVSSEVSFEGKMLNLYMDVQREIFLKYLKKP